MSDAMLQKTIDLVSSMEAKNETQQLAKYELIEYTERLHEENQKYKEVIDKSIDEIETGYFIDGDEEYSYLETWFGVETLLNILKEVE